MKIEDTMTLSGYAWIDDDGELNWALKEDMEDVEIKERPKDCTPVMIEITPSQEWVVKKQKEHDFLGDLQSQMGKFADDLGKLEKSLRAGREA